MTEAFVSWSGGKDSCLACYRAMTSGIKVRYLLNMVTGDGQRSKSHGLSTELLRAQAKAMGIQLVQQRTMDTDYEVKFKEAVLDFKSKGITMGVFGDIDFNAHKQWIDRVCSDGGVTPFLPLWEEDQESIMKDFIDSGFVSVVVATQADILGQEWLGRNIDSTFLADLKKLGKMQKITPCGEAGEYHSFVINGPLFSKRIEIMESNKEQKENHWFLRINRYELKPKII